jgi:hypothetical protein
MISAARTRERRTAARRRWREWAKRQRSRRACASIVYDGQILARLIEGHWLPRNREEVYDRRQIGSAITDLLTHAELPAKKF